MNELMNEEGKEASGMKEGRKGQGSRERALHTYSIATVISYHIILYLIMLGRSCLTLFFNCWANDRPVVISYVMSHHVEYEVQ